MKRNIFEPLVGVKAKTTHVESMQHSKNERWLFGVLSADDDAPTVEDEKITRTYYYFFGIVFVLLFVLISRAFYLQIIEGNERLLLAQENRFRVNEIRAPRGIFYDRNKKALVKNVPNYEVTVIPMDLPATGAERNKLYEKLSAVIGMPKEEIKRITESKEDQNKISENKRLFYTQPIILSKSVTRDVALIFESKESDFKGFYVDINPIREYLDSGLLAHVFGYVGRISEEEWVKNTQYNMTDFIGKIGLEKTYEKILKGIDGEDKIEVNSEGKIIRNYGQEEPKPGDNLMLTIDFDLQKKLAESLTKQMEKAKVKKGAAIAINPQNGEILALVNLPSYDNNLFARGISESDYRKLLEDKTNPLLNRAISGEYPSGSIIKPYIAAASLEEGLITESTTVNSTGGIKIGEWEFPDWKAGGHGVTNVVKAIAQSVNTFFYAIGGGYEKIKGLGPDLMKKYLEKFNFGTYSGIDIDGEAKGHIPSPEWKEDVKNEQWYLGDTYHMAIGQGDVLVTPLQMVNGLQAIANGGKMYKLHFLKAVMDSSGRIISEKSSEVVKENFISKKTLDIVRAGMRETITTGSGRSLSTLPVPAAGKTGTAQFGPNNVNKHAWFTVFAPYDNPEIAMVVLLEGAGGGDEFAAPVAKETLQWYFTRK